MAITTEAKAREEIRNIIKTAIRDYIEDCENPNEKRIQEVKDAGWMVHNVPSVLNFSDKSIDLRVYEGILVSPILTDYMAALKWGREELLLHRLVRDAAFAGYQQEVREDRVRMNLQRAIDRTAAEKTKAKKRFWQFLG